jgi:hypothetical protein
MKSPSATRATVDIANLTLNMPPVKRSDAKSVNHAIRPARHRRVGSRE